MVVFWPSPGRRARRETRRHRPVPAARPFSNAEIEPLRHRRPSLRQRFLQCRKRYLPTYRYRDYYRYTVYRFIHYSNNLNEDAYRGRPRRWKGINRSHTHTPLLYFRSRAAHVRVSNPLPNNLISGFRFLSVVVVVVEILLEPVVEGTDLIYVYIYIYVYRTGPTASVV